MSIVIRDVREHELDSVLALNNAAGVTILPLDRTRLRSSQMLLNLINKTNVYTERVE